MCPKSKRWQLDGWRSKAPLSCNSSYFLTCVPREDRKTARCGLMEQGNASVNISNKYLQECQVMLSIKN